MHDFYDKPHSVLTTDKNSPKKHDPVLSNTKKTNNVVIYEVLVKQNLQSFWKTLIPLDFFREMPSRTFVRWEI